MRITAITEQYPSDFKPYFDTQFADLVAKGHDLTVLASGSFTAAPTEKVRAWGLDQRTRRYPLDLRTALRALRPSVLLRVPGAWRALAPERRTPLRAARLAMVARSRPDAVLVHGLLAGRMFTGSGGGWAGSRVGCYYHGGELPSTPSVPRWAAEAVFAEADVVFTNTRFSADHAIGRGCPPDKVHVLPVGLDLEAYPELPKEDAKGRPIRLLSASRMSPEKGTLHALEALAILDGEGFGDFRYTLTGAGPYRDELERFATTHGLMDRVRFIGVVSTGRVIQEMGAADILLLPSLHLGNWAENQAVAVQEAVLMGAMALTTTTGGLPESVPAGMRRFQVPPADPVAIAQTIREIAALDAGELGILRDEGRRFVRERYDIRQLNDRMLGLLA